MSDLNIVEMRSAALAIVEDRIEATHSLINDVRASIDDIPWSWWNIFFDPHYGMRKTLHDSRMLHALTLSTLLFHRRVLTFGADESAIEVASQYIYPNDYLR